MILIISGCLGGSGGLQAKHQVAILYRFFMQWSVKKDVLFEDLPDRSSRLLAERNLEHVKIVQPVSCNLPGPAVAGDHPRFFYQDSL